MKNIQSSFHFQLENYNRVDHQTNHKRQCSLHSKRSIKRVQMIQTSACKQSQSRMSSLLCASYSRSHQTPATQANSNLQSDDLSCKEYR